MIGMQAFEERRCQQCDGNGWWTDVKPYKPFPEFPDDWPLTGRFEVAEGYAVEVYEDTYSDSDVWLYVWDDGERFHDYVDYRSRHEDEQREFYADANERLAKSQQGILICDGCEGTGLNRHEHTPPWGGYDYEERFLNHDYVQEVRFGYDGYDG